MDYFLLSLTDFDCISEFCICDPDEYSDHCALYICFDLKGVDAFSGSTDETNCIRKLVWSCENEEMFRNSLSEQLSHYDELILKAESDNATVSEVVDCFATSLFDIAYSHFGKTMQSTQPHQFQKYKTNPWFDNTCKSAKKDFNRAKHSYTQNPSNTNRVNLTRCRSKLNKAKRRAKAIFKFEEGKRIKNLAKSNSKTFWKEIKKRYKKKSNVADNLTADDFLEHFCRIFDSTTGNSGTNDLQEMHVDEQNVILDSQFTTDELKKVIFNLKSNKSPVIDGLIAEIFKSSYDILSPLLLRLFNVIFISGSYPSQWSEGLITPIHKKDDLEDVNNYRGITLINVLSKIYLHLLNNRLLKWASENNKLSDCQFGFQKNKTTVDCIFIFHALISKILSQGGKLYCCFIDYQKAFDLINRSFLWQKLVRNGCTNTMTKALKAMYSSVKACVRYKNKCSDFFNINAGVKQGDPLSPVLFIFFINDILQSISSNVDNTLSINDLNLFMLLYADDAVLFAKSAETLQNMLTKLHEYSTLWDLKVNTEKTKIMIFERGRKTNVDLYYSITLLEVIDNFKYLGTMFYKNGGWNRTQKYLSDYGSFAFHNLNRLFQNITLSDTEKFQIIRLSGGLRT